MLKVVGTHCYLGGFLLGLQDAGLKVIATFESWQPGAKGAINLGLPVREFDELSSNSLLADMVVANPPCSRFSHLSLSFFKGRSGAHDDPETFPELVEVRDVSLSTGARIIWWETGPLAWSLGRNLIKAYHKSLHSLWNVVTTLIIKLDLRYIGVPQRRPRVHIIHLASNTPPPYVPFSDWPIIQTVGEWINEKIADRKLVNPIIVHKRDQNVPSPLLWAYNQNDKQKFRSMVPKIIGYHDDYAHAVVSRRVMVWREEDRWWDFLEYAALMTYPLDKSLHLLNLKKNPVDAEVLLAKSVAPAATQWISQNILRPWLNDDQQAHHVNKEGSFVHNGVSPISWGENLWGLDLSINDNRKRISYQKQLPFW